MLGAGPALAAGGAGGQPTNDTSLHAGSGGADGSGGSGGLNDTTVNANGGAGGSSTSAGPTAGSAASTGTFAGATAGTGGAAGAGSNTVSPGVLQGDNGAAGQSQTGDMSSGNGYGGGGGGGFQGATIGSGVGSSSNSYTGGAGGAGGNGYWAAGGGGAGGYGSILLGPTGSYTATGSSTGGAGGKGGDAFSQGGGGGGGGGGFLLNATTPGLGFTNTGTISGGAGGAGGSELLPARSNASGGGGGAGGIGITLTGSALTVTNSGAVSGGAGGAGGAGGGGVGGTNSNGGARGANGAGGVGVLGANLGIVNSGSITGGLGGDGVTRAAAVEFTGGSNSLTLNTGAALTGAVAIDSGATASIVAGANGLSLSSPLLLGGTGTIDTNGHDMGWSGPISGAAGLVKSGAGTLTLSGANVYTGPTSINAGTLRAGAAGALSSASAFTVGSGATLDLAGNSQTVASMSNSGTVSLVGSAPGTTLTVTGPWVGNGGTLRLGTALGNSSSATDRLVLSGSTAIASGTTNVQITNLGGLGALTTGNGIEVVSAINGATTTAQTTKSAFALAGGHVDAGAYEYRLYAADASGAGENWYLRSSAVVTPPANGGGSGGSGGNGGAGSSGGSTGGGGGISVPTYRAEVPLYAALPEQFRQANLTMLGSMRQRLGDDGPPPGNDAGPAMPDQGYRQAWARIISTDRSISQGGTVSPTSKGRLSGFQAGTDLWADAHWRAGVYVGELNGDMSVSGFARGIVNYAAGTNDLRSQYLGAYATWKNDSGLYVDGVLQAGRHRYTASPTLGFSSTGKGSSLLASIEVGQAFAIAPGWTIEPQLQLVHQRISLDDTGIAAALVQQHSHSGWLARAGVRVKGEIATSAGLLQPYVRFNVYRSGSGTDISRFVGPSAYTDIATRTGGTSTELAAGATLQLTQNASLYAELGKTWASGGAVRTRSNGIEGSVGVKIRW